VLSYGLEPENTYQVTIEAADSDGGLIGTAYVDYPNPVDGVIKNVHIDESGTITWDNYYTGTYYLFANDVRIDETYDELSADLNGALEAGIEKGILKKSDDGTYSIKLYNVTNDSYVASWEGTYTYNTDTENPYFDNIRLENGYVYWDSAPYSDNVDAVIDGVEVTEFYSGVSLPETIDNLIKSGKIDNTVTDHDIVVTAYRESGDDNYKIYEWQTSYHYESEQEVLTGFPEDMAINEDGYLSWSYFKDVEYFGFYINDYHNENYTVESLNLRDEIDSLIENETITKSDNDSYYFKLEALDKDGNVLDYFEDNYT
jgi:hypothetical protein